MKNKTSKERKAFEAFWAEKMCTQGKHLWIESNNLVFYEDDEEKWLTCAACGKTGRLRKDKKK